MFVFSETQYWFDEETSDWGLEIISLTKLHAKDSGFLVNDQLKLVVEIEVLEVIGQLDVSESVDVNGFHVLPSQVRIHKNPTLYFSFWVYIIRCLRYGFTFYIKFFYYIGR